MNCLWCTSSCNGQTHHVLICGNKNQTHATDETELNFLQFTQYRVETDWINTMGCIYNTKTDFVCVCVCVCVCVRARACVCVCVCARARV